MSKIVLNPKHLMNTTTALLLVAFVASCSRSPYKKRKGCRGNGSWYGHRNLGIVDTFQNNNSSDFYWCGRPNISKNL